MTETTLVCEMCRQEFVSSAHRGQIPKTCSKTCWTQKSNQYQKEFRKASIEGSLYSIVAGARNRAKRKGLDCNIDSTFIINLYKQQAGLCAVSKLPLESSAGNTKRFSNPRTISIDRIDSKRGYTQDNVRLVTYMYNSARGQWSDDEVLKMCQGILQ